MSSKRELAACAERLLSLLEVPDGVELEETTHPDATERLAEFVLRKR